ncbi:uncharacterized protein LOC132308389 [Cornus florida]|uniref:uncharacterized protein LOC132308389 n=1 Tax=Cornus florida TaxID=4283 RepID=UPI00289BC292|nr:uncharacterized protein LOC132308389 [Cornus florida]
MISIYQLQPTYQKILLILSHITINHIHKSLNCMWHKITHPMKFPRTHIPISNLTLVLQRVASQKHRLIILPIRSVLILCTLPCQLLPIGTTHQLFNTIKAAEMELFQKFNQILHRYTNMTAITRHHLRKLVRHTRLQGSQLGLWHSMMCLLQWTTLRKSLELLTNPSAGQFLLIGNNSQVTL